LYSSKIFFYLISCSIFPSVETVVGVISSFLCHRKRGEEERREVIERGKGERKGKRGEKGGYHSILCSQYHKEMSQHLSLRCQKLSL
jgi:hypothetical protein